MQIKYDQSFGIIPVRKNKGEWEIFLINQFSRIGNNTYWVFPKGHKEGDETPLQTAKRELKEETNMEVTRVIEDPTFELAYNFIFDGSKIEKSVTFFIGTIDNNAYRLDPEEVKEAGWFSLEDVGQRLDYSDTKKMFEEVKSYLKVNPNLLNIA
jgi:8-oxo-dGTP pyrophosphatase MutT (NUDIX family)